MDFAIVWAEILHSDFRTPERSLGERAGSRAREFFGCLRFSECFSSIETALRWPWNTERVGGGRKGRQAELWEKWFLVWGNHLTDLCTPRINKQYEEKNAPTNNCIKPMLLEKCGVKRNDWTVSWWYIWNSSAPPVILSNNLVLLQCICTEPYSPLVA